LGKPARAIRNPKSQIRNRPTDEFRPTQSEFCPTPGAKFRRFRPTPTRQLPTSKRLARMLWGEIGRISPHIKKEKM
jgi:hypothetical protein